MVQQVRLPRSGRATICSMPSVLDLELTRFRAMGCDALNAWAFAHTVVRRIDDDEVCLAPIEAVMLSRLRCYQLGKSDRHLRDIHQMLRISGDLVDRPELERWAARLGVEGGWKRAQDFQEP